MVCICWMAWSMAAAAAFQAAADDAPSAFSSVFGDSVVCAVSGNGGLTVGLSNAGDVAACQWPSPGYYDQLDTHRRAAASAASPPRGVGWGLRSDGETNWIRGEGWTFAQTLPLSPAPIIETTCERANSELTVKQTTFVHHADDILLLHVSVSGAKESDVLCFYANFAPTTRLVPEIPVADWLFDVSNAFAVFASGDPLRIYHFRPERPGARDWERLREAVSKGTLPRDAVDFGAGTWIAYQAATPAAAQAGDSALAFALGSGSEPFETWVRVAFGKTREQVDALLDGMKDAAFTELAAVTAAHWQERLRAAAPSPTGDPSSANCLTTLLELTDRSSGAVVESPVAYPPLALDSPRQAYWTTRALDLAGFHDIAERHTTFFANAVRTTDSPGAPAGSVPAALYTDGTQAIPELALDAGAAAWVLAAIGQHAQFLEDSARKAYLESIWATAERCAEFLAAWTAESAATPLLSFDPERYREAPAQDVLPIAFMGLESALEIAAALGIPAPPEWRKQKQELNVLLLARYARQVPGETQQEPFPPGLAETLDRVLPPSEERDARWLAQLEQAQGKRALQLLCDLTLAWRSKPEKLAKLRPLREPTIAKTPETQPPNAQTAAWTYIVLGTGYETRPDQP